MNGYQKLKADKERKEKLLEIATSAMINAMEAKNNGTKQRILAKAVLELQKEAER